MWWVTWLRTVMRTRPCLEVAWGLGGLQVMHCVMYPWATVPGRAPHLFLNPKS
jgi:hypothetical protein